MKLHLLFLSCLFLSSWQQNLYSPYPQFLGNSLSNQLFPLPYSPAFVEELIQQRNLAIFHLLEAKGLLHSNEEVSQCTATTSMYCVYSSMHSTRTCLHCETYKRKVTMNAFCNRRAMRRAPGSQTWRVASWRGRTGPNLVGLPSSYRPFSSAAPSTGARAHRTVSWRLPWRRPRRLTASRPPRSRWVRRPWRAVNVAISRSSAIYWPAWTTRN